MRFWAGLFLLLPLSGQVFTPPNCIVRAGSVPTIRAEGLSEAIGDILLQCTGASPANAGQTNLKLFLNTSINNHFTSDGHSDALLLVDEPAPDKQKLTVNVFRGHANGGNSLIWQGIPISPPSTAGTRIFRITNVRANAALLGPPPNGSAPLFVTAFLAATIGSTPINVTNPQQVVGLVQPGLNFSVLQSGVFNDCRPQNQGVFPGTTATRAAPQFILRFQETFASSFKSRVSPNCSGTFPATGDCTSETGFFSNDPTFDVLPRPAAGTLLSARFNNVPNFTRVFVGAQPQTATGIGARIVSTGTFVNARSSDGTTIAEIPIVNNSATAVWEVIGTNPNAVENFDFGVWWVTTSGGTRDSSPASGPYTVSGSFAPLGNRFIPRFVDETSRNALTQISVPSTSLLFPFVSDTNGFDTGLAISNTSVDALSSFRPGPGEHPIAEVIDCNPSGPNLSFGNAVNTNFNFFGAPGSAGLGGGQYISILGRQGALTGLSPSIGESFGNLPKEDRAVTNGWLTVDLDSTSTPTTARLLVNPAGVPNGTAQKRVSITASSGQTSVFNVTLKVDTTSPVFERAGVTHAASYASGFVSPGLAIVIFGARFGPAALATLALNPDGTVATALGGTRVLFDGVAAPMIYAVNGQISCFVPFGVEGKASTKMVVEYNGVKSPEVTVPVVANNPSMLTADSSGAGQLAAFNQDYTLNGPDAAANRGDFVFLFGTGGGQTTPGGRDGRVAVAPLSTLKYPMTVTIDGLPAEVQYQGPAPGLVEGVFQLNVRVPAGARPGNNVPVTVTQNGVTSQLGNSIAVK